MFQAKIKSIVMMLLIIMGTCCCLAISLANGAATSMPAETTPVSSLESPSEGVATSSVDSEYSANNDQDGGEDICLRCYDKVKTAQDMIAIHTSLLEKQKKLIHRKNKAAAAAAAAAAASPAHVSGSNDGEEIGRNTNTRSRLNNRKFNNNNNNNNNENNPYEIINSNNYNNNQQQGTVRSRTLQTSEPIVISRLRVARAASVSAISASSSASSIASNTNNKLNSLNKKEPDLKRLKQEQQQQLNATCKSLLLVQECLSELERECIGNLQFHSLEVYSNQWHSKLICPYRNNPNLKVFPGLRSIHEEIEQPKVPIPRRISSEEEVRGRLHEMFPNGFARPFGVMLKPTLTTSASQRFGQLLQAQQQQQQQQEGNKQQQLRDFSGHFNHNHHQQNSYVRVVDDFHIGRILLVPCCFAIMVAVVALASLYYWRPFDEKA